MIKINQLISQMILNYIRLNNLVHKELVYNNMGIQE